MNTDSKKLEKPSEICSGQQDELCARYEGSYIKVFFASLCAIIILIFAINIEINVPTRSMAEVLKFTFHQIMQYLLYILIPIVVYVLIETGVCVFSGIKANVTIYETHFEFNQNIFCRLNYNIKYTDIDRIESNTVHGGWILSGHGLSVLSIYFKEPLTEASFTEFKNNNMLSQIKRIISRKSCNRYRMELTTSQFSKDAYEKIREELIRRTSVLNTADALAKSAEGA